MQTFSRTNETHETNIWFLYDKSKSLSLRNFCYIFLLACFDDEVLFICQAFKKVFIFNIQKELFSDVFQNSFLKTFAILTGKHLHWSLF